MAKWVTFMTPIDVVGGKLAPSKETRKQGGWAKFFGLRRLTRSIAGPYETPKMVMALYTRARSTPYTPDELARFDKFAAVSQATAAVMHNPQSLQQALIEFGAQTTYKTLRNYVWHREWVNYQE